MGDRNPDPNPSPNQAVLQGAFVGYLNRLKPLTLVRELTKAEIVRSNLAHAAVSRALSIRADLEAHLGKIMLKATAGQRLDHPPEPGLAAKLRSCLTRPSNPHPHPHPNPNPNT